MSLRVKIELALIAIVGLVVALGYGVQRQVVLPAFIPLEKEEAAGQMVRCFEAIRAQLDTINRECAVWAREAGADDATRLPEMLAQRDLDLAYAFDGGGKPIWGMTADPGTGAPLAIEPFSADAAWRLNPAVLGGEDTGVAGVWLTAHEPALIASHPFPRGTGGAFRDGFLVAGRFLGRDVLAAIHEESGFTFHVRPLNKPIPNEVREVLGRLVEPGTSYVDMPAGEDRCTVYATFPDIAGQPALMLSRRVELGAFPRALRAVQWGLLVQLGFSLISMLIMVLLLETILMRPLRKLINHVTRIRKTQDFSARLALEREDELGALAGEFDQMMAHIEQDEASRLQAEAALRESEQRFALAASGANDGIWDWNLDTDEVYFSPRWKSMLGYEEGEIGTSPEDWFRLVYPEDLEELKRALDKPREDHGEHFECEYRMRHKDGTCRWMLCRGVAVRNAEGQPTRTAGSQSDVTHRRTSEEKLAHDALHDQLTKLPNRALLLDRLRSAIRNAKRFNGYQFAVLFLDLDHFKVVNDSLGHVAGDKLLFEFARQLEACLRDDHRMDRECDTIARFGGDEFVILLNDIRDIADAIRVAERIQEMLKTPFRIGEHEAFTSTSIGIALSATGYSEPEEFLRNADTALYRAKAHGRACHEVFDSGMHAQAVKRLQTEVDLRRAIDRREFVVYYQPILDLRSGKIHAFEALVRWLHPERGLVPPFDFIPVAEETGLIIPIGGQVLDEACRQVQVWHETLPGATGLVMSVNLSTRQFRQDDVLHPIAGVLEDTQLDASLLKLEITESAIMENVEQVIATMEQMRDMGILLSIDDFGTGYSSLSYLHRFPIKVLKIDRAFVKDMHETPENLQIVRTIMSLAKNLNMEVIAEGVETEAQLAQLRELGCEYGQGYLFSKPMPAEEAERMILDDPTW